MRGDRPCGCERDKTVTGGLGGSEAARSFKYANHILTFVPLGVIS